MPDRRSRVALLLTCEHGGRDIPPEYRPLFRGQARRLAGHQGYDIGALACARGLAERRRAPLIHSETSRLLVDLNRSLHHPRLFSETTRALPRATREDILARHYHPHRDRVERWIRSRIDAGRVVVHVGVHSFTPVLEGRRRDAEVGLLYDPRRPLESALCRQWQAAMAGEFHVRRNYPYRGVSDGLTTWLRTRFPAASYAGIELELNQAVLVPRPRAGLVDLLASALARAEMSLSSRNRRRS